MKKDIYRILFDNGNPILYYKTDYGYYPIVCRNKTIYINFNLEKRLHAKA